MAEKCITSSVDLFPVSLPSGFMQLKVNFKEAYHDDESSIYGLGSNTLVISENTAKTLNVMVQDKVAWMVLKLNLQFPDPGKNAKCESKRLIQVVLDNLVSDDSVALSEDFLFNLEYSLSLRTSSHLTTTMKPTHVIMSCANQYPHVPPKATKVVISLIQLETAPEDDFVDKLLQSYFSFPRYLCKNDVFGVHIPDYIGLESINTLNMDLIYFKVSDIEGPKYLNSEIYNNTCYGYFVDSYVTLYQVSNFQDLHPSKRVVVSSYVGLKEVLNDASMLKSLRSRGHNLIPECFDHLFEILYKWTEPFLCGYKNLQDMELIPIFLVSGPNGSGKTMLIEAVGQYFGMNYWRIDCVMLGESVPGQVEAKLKALFNKLNSLPPTILHFSNIEALFEDADGKDDVRVLTCFEQLLKTLKSKLPMVIIASTSNIKSMSSSINQLFLESIKINPLNQRERENVLSWFVSCGHGQVDKQILEDVAAQTSGFLLRDLETLASLAFKENYCRVKGGNSSNREFVFSDFSKIIGMMRKVFSESIGAPKVPSVLWKDVGGLEHLKKEILRSLRSNMFSSGLKRSGLLLHGPPGTGKTLLAKAVATQCGRNFLSVKGPELLNMYVGQSEQNVRDLFELAKAATPCIIFFDELDSLAPNRGRSGDSGGVMDRVVSQLLAEMDGLGSSGDVFILGATNRPDLIDPALLRPGRLDKMLYVGPCEDRVSQLSVLTALTHKLQLAPDVDWDQLVCRLPQKVSGAQLSAMCSAAWLASARETILGGQPSQCSVVVEQKHFLAALDSTFS